MCIRDRYIATALEIYVTGSLNVFNHQSNVDSNNRIVCYDIKELGKQLKKSVCWWSRIRCGTALPLTALPTSPPVITSVSYTHLDVYQRQLQGVSVSRISTPCWKRHRPSRRSLKQKCQRAESGCPMKSSLPMTQNNGWKPFRNMPTSQSWTQPPSTLSLIHI